MTLDQFLRLVASEPPVTFERDVRIVGPEVFEEMRRRGSMPVTEFLADPRHTFERRTVRYGHVLGPGLDEDAIDAWAGRWPKHPLPADLVRLLMRVNGIHLRADLETGTSYEGLAPLEDWDLARRKMWGPDADASSLGDRYLALTYHADSAAFAVLDVEKARYFLMDACGADESCPIGESVGDLLAWLWRSRLPPERPPSPGPSLTREDG